MDSRIITGLAPVSTDSSVILGKFERYGAIDSFYRVLNLFIVTYEDSRDAEDAKKEMSLVYDPSGIFREDKVLARPPSEEVKGEYLFGSSFIDAKKALGSRESPSVKSDHVRRSYTMASKGHGIRLSQMTDGAVWDQMGRFGKICEFGSSHGKRSVLYEDQRDAEDASSAYGLEHDGCKVHLPSWAGCTH